MNLNTCLIKRFHQLRLVTTPIQNYGMSDLQKDQTLIDAPLVDAKKINTEKSEPMPTLAPTTDIIRPMDNLLYGTTVLDGQTFPTTYVRLQQFVLDSTKTAGEQAYQFRLDWNNIRALINNPTIFRENHMFVTGVAQFKLLMKGSPSWWAAMCTTFNPDPHYATDSVTRAVINQGYARGYQARWFKPLFQCTKGDSSCEVIVPFFMPQSAIRTRSFQLAEDFEDYGYLDTQIFYPFGTLDVRYFTDQKVSSTDVSKPTFSIYMGASIKYGGSYYSSSRVLSPS